jgi:uncharacterized protein with HEPN domain
MSDDTVYLQHILECIRRIENHAAGGREQFFQSDVLQDATLRNLQTLAESCQRLSPASKATQPQISWSGISGFRNVVVHNYMGVDLPEVWTIIEVDLAPLKQAIQAMLQAR